MAMTGHLFEEMMATCHSHGIAGKVAGKSSNTQGASDSSGRYTRWIVTRATSAVSS